MFLSYSQGLDQSLWTACAMVSCIARSSPRACDPPISWPDAEGVFWKPCCCQSRGSSGIEPVSSLCPSSCYLSDDWLTALTHICLAWMWPNVAPIALIMPMNYSCLLQRGLIWHLWAKKCVLALDRGRERLNKLCVHFVEMMRSTTADFLPCVFLRIVL